MCYKGHKGAMGWPGGNDEDFPKWAIDILQFRNNKLHEDYVINNYKFEEVEVRYDDIDHSLNEMVKFVMKYWKNEKDK